VPVRVQLPAHPPAIDDRSREEILHVLEQIASAVESIPAASVFWDSMKTSLLQIDVSGFRIVYRFGTAMPAIRVIELQRIPA
jgi:hypothetical protein